MFRQIEKPEVWARWGELSALIAPAVRQDPKILITGVLNKLMAGNAAMIEVTTEGVTGLLVIEIIEDAQEHLICWASYIAGEIDLPPKAWLKAMRGFMAELERLARNAGCYAIRIGGRDYSRIFPDFTPMKDVPNRMQKVLLDG